MKISLNWVKDFIPLNVSDEEIDDKLTKSGLEVEGLEKFESIPGGLKGVVIGEVLTCEKHPNADKLSVTTVDLGNNTIAPIVCGAPNVAAGQKVVVATVGTTLYPGDGESFKIKKAKIRGEVSEGMICAEDELGLGNSHDGIIVLNTTLPNGTPAASHFDIETDTIIEIGLTPNRADGASHFGVARELRALYPGKQASLPELHNFRIEKDKTDFKIEVENTQACPRYAGLLIEGVTVKPSPDWLQNRLKSIGLAPINNIVDITNYVLHGLGQPMHAFDADKISTKTVRIKTLPKGTKFTTLDGVERELLATDLMVCDGDKPMCIAGVFGGLESGVTESTTTVFLESAYFDANFVRKTSLTHTLKTDASFRFERGTDPNMVLSAIQYAALLIKELAGGTIASNILDHYPTPILDFTVNVKYANIDRLIGKSIGKKLIQEILESLDIIVQEETEKDMTLSVPPYRVDVQREADVIEEVLRIYGYDNVELSDYLASDFLAEAPENNVDHKKTIIGETLAGNGFYEITTNSLTKPQYAEGVSYLNTEESVKILNKLSDDLGVLRQSLLHSGLEVINNNINRRETNLRLFEFGKEYRRINEEYIETEKLAIYVTGNEHQESWAKSSKKAGFGQINNALTSVLQKLNINGVTSEKLSNDLYSDGISLVHNKRTIGTAGIISKKQLKVCGVKQEVYYAELDIKTIFDQKGLKLKFSELSKFPKVRRDLSLVLDKRVSYQDIKSLAEKTERNLLNEINVFDVYEGEHIEDGKKSYSVYFMLQDNKQTLTDKVIDKTMTKLMNAFEKELGAIIRK